jgi:WD40 repeat protein
MILLPIAIVVHFSHNGYSQISPTNTILSEKDIYSYGISMDKSKVVLTNAVAEVRDLKTNHLISSFSGHTTQIAGRGPKILSSSFSRDGKEVITGSAWDATVKGWDSYTGQEKFTINTYSFDHPDLYGRIGSVLYVGFTPDGTKILTQDATSYGGAFQVWDAYTQKELFMKFCDYIAIETEYTPDGKYMLMKNDGYPKIYSTESWDMLAEIKGGNATFSNDGKSYFYSIGVNLGQSSVIIQKDIMNNKIINQSEEFYRPYYRFTILNDGKQVIFQNEEQTELTLHNFEDKHEYQISNTTSDCKYKKLQLSFDLKSFFGLCDNKLFIWDISTIPSASIQNLK